jgi:hypothetical protein
MRTLLYTTAAILAVAVVVVGAGTTFAADKAQTTKFFNVDAFDQYLPGVGYFKGSLAGQHSYVWMDGSAIEGDFVGPKNPRPGLVCGTGAGGLAFGPSPRTGC